jgi:hypothetical protein
MYVAALRKMALLHDALKVANVNVEKMCLFKRVCHEHWAVIVWKQDCVNILFIIGCIFYTSVLSCRVTEQLTTTFVVA